MSAATPLFPPPALPEISALERTLARWLEYVAQLRRVSPRARRDYLRLRAEEYQATYQELCRQCDACIEHCVGKQQDYLRHVKCLLEPWTDLEAVGHSPRGILSDLLSQCREVQRALSGYDERRERRRRIIRGVLIAVLFIAVSFPLARILRPQTLALADDVRRYEYQVMVYADRITDRQRIVAATFIIVTIGIASLYTSRQY